MWELCCFDHIYCYRVKRIDHICLKCMWWSIALDMGCWNASVRVLNLYRLAKQAFPIL